MQTLVDLLRQSAERYGDSTALTITPGFRQQRWSYERLWDFSEGVATLLAQRGLEKGDRAIIWSVNRPEWVAAFFGCMRAGVVAVPLDVRTAPDFVERVVEYTTPKVAFLSRQTPDGPLRDSVPIVLLDDLEELVESADHDAGLPDVGADDLAEVMFTSGTTGDPKGVMLTHGNHRHQRAGRGRGGADQAVGPAVLPAAPEPHAGADGRAAGAAERRRVRRIPGQPPADGDLQDPARQPRDEYRAGASGATALS